MPVKIFTDSLHKIAYSTDASVYREVPAGVAFPETIDEIKHLLDEARLRHTHIIPRAGGTSLAGQVVSAQAETAERQAPCTADGQVATPDSRS